MSKAILLIEDNETTRSSQFAPSKNPTSATRSWWLATERRRSSKSSGRFGARADEVLPVVVLTASREDDDLIRSYSLGANAYARKPVDFTELTELTDAARALGPFWASLNEAPPFSKGN